MDAAKLADKLHEDFPDLTFVIGPRACWSPKDGQIAYRADGEDEADVWGLLHELGHAILKHGSYRTDIGLLRKEAAAWAKAEAIGQNYEVNIDNEYVQNCLETYRNWLYKRSLCPQCGAQGTQKKEQQYCCLNCAASWRVSISRFCRPYRSRTKLNKEKSQEVYSRLFVTTTN
jgi:hypothetical protein